MDVLTYMRTNPNNVVGVFGDNSQPIHNNSRLSNFDTRMKQAGEAVRLKIKDKMVRVGLK